MKKDNNLKKNPDRNKQLLLEALEKHNGLVSPACKEAGMSRSQFYVYYNNDELFKKAVDDINDVVIDMVETQLFKKIKEGSERSILFFMKYRGKKRGYSDSLDITSNGEKITEIKLIQISRKNDEEENED